jgi:hypothetical protein
MDGRGVERRRGHQRHEVRDLGEGRGRVANRDIDLAAHPREAQLVGGRPWEPLLALEKQLHVEAVAAIGRDPAGGGVRMGEKALVLQAGELGPHGRGAPGDVGAVGERAGADRAPVIHVALDQQSEDLALAFAQH